MGSAPDGKTVTFKLRKGSPSCRKRSPRTLELNAMKCGRRSEIRIDTAGSDRGRNAGCRERSFKYERPMRWLLLRACRLG